MAEKEFPLEAEEPPPELLLNMPAGAWDGVASGDGDSCGPWLLLRVDPPPPTLLSDWMVTEDFLRCIRGGESVRTIGGLSNLQEDAFGETDLELAFDPGALPPPPPKPPAGLKVCFGELMVTTLFFSLARDLRLSLLKGFVPTFPVKLGEVLRVIGDVIGGAWEEAGLLPVDALKTGEEPLL